MPRRMAGLVAAGVVAAAIGGLTLTEPTGRASAAPAVVAARPAPPPFTCDPARPSEPSFYGPSASALYGAVFSQSFAAPDLRAGYTPQGMTAWPQPDGSALLLIGEFRKGHRSRLVAVDPRTGARYGTVEIAPAHLGGIAIVGDWLFAQDRPNPNGEQVRKYRLSTVAHALGVSHTSGGRTMPYVKQAGRLQDVYFASFLSSYGGSLWAGHHGINETKMFEYRVDSAGILHRVGGAYQVPKFTDGVVVTADRFLFVSHAPEGVSRGFGVMTVAARSAKLSDHPVRCFAMPNLGEGTTLVDGAVYTVFESGTPKDHPAAADRIPFLHRADYATLAALLPR